MADQEKSSEGQKSGGFVAKIVATIFGAVIAPVLVAIGVKWADPELWKGKSTQPVTTEAATHASTAPITTAVAGPIRPGDVIHLLTPNLGERFHSFGWSSMKEESVRNDNVDPALFPYDAATKTLQVPAMYEGKLVTNKAYQNYLLTFEYKWGTKTHKLREGKARQARIYVHAAGGDDYSLRPSIVITVQEGGWPANWALGLLPAEETLTAVGKVKEMWKTPPGKGGKDAFYVEVYDPAAPPVKLAMGGKPHPGVVDLKPWSGYVYNKYQDIKLAHREDREGLHPPRDPSIPGEWNKVEVACYGNTIALHVNGKEVNALTNLTLTGGRIGFAPNFAEIAIRRFDVEPPRKL